MCILATEPRCAFKVARGAGAVWVIAGDWCCHTVCCGLWKARHVERSCLLMRSFSQFYENPNYTIMMTTVELHWYRSFFLQQQSIATLAMSKNKVSSSYAQYAGGKVVRRNAAESAAGGKAACRRAASASSSGCQAARWSAAALEVYHAMPSYAARGPS